MEVEDQGNEYNYSKSSIVGKLITSVKKMSAKSDNNNLGDLLDIFMEHLNESQEYLSNGVLNMKFAEAALFIQSSTELYGKTVDMLLDTALQYQIQLCSYYQTEEAVAEITKVTERLNKKRKKKLVVQRQIVWISSFDILKFQERKTRKFLRKINSFDVMVDDADSENESILNGDFLDMEFINLFDDFDSDCENMESSIALNEFNVTQIFGAEWETSSTTDNYNCIITKLLVVNIIRLSESVISAFLSKLMEARRTEVQENTTVNTTAPTNTQQLNTTDQGYDSEQPLHTSNHNLLRSMRKSYDDSGIVFSHFSNQTNKEVPEEGPDITNGIEKIVLLEEDEAMSAVNATVTNAEKGHTSQLHFNNAFLPLISSTPKSMVPVVRVERLSRKRLMQYDISLKPKTKKAATSRWLKTYSSSKKTFEKFYNQNYVPSVDEGVVEPWDSEEEDGDGDYSNVAAADSMMEINLMLKELDETAEYELSRNAVNETVNHNIPPSTTNKTLSVISSSSNVQKICTPEEARRKKALLQWKDFIHPILKKAKSRSSFDIHKYESQVLDKIPVDTPLPFKDLVAGNETAEVARYFLASLQLANTYNIELLDTGNGDLASNQLKMRLLSKERYHEHLDEYQAPSKNSIREKLAHIHSIQKLGQSSQSRLSTLHRNQTLIQSFIPKRNRSKRQKIP